MIAIAKTMSPALRGVVAMALAAAILTVHDVGTKILLETYSVGQIITVRQIFGLARSGGDHSGDIGLGNGPDRQQGCGCLRARCCSS